MSARKTTGVDAEADERTIKLAYRKMALQFRKWFYSAMFVLL